MTIPYHYLSVLIILTTVPITSSAMPVAPPWGDIRVKHAYNTIPGNWESLSPPPGTVTDLYIALKPHNDNDLIDTLYEVTSPGHPKK